MESGGSVFNPLQLWADLKAAAPSLIPVSFWHWNLGVTTVGNDVSVIADQEGSNDKTQGVSDDRPELKSDHIELDSSNTEHMNVAISEIANDWTYGLVCDIQTVGEDDLFDCQTGRMNFMLQTNTAKVGYFDGGYRNSGSGAITGKQHLLYLPKITNAGEIRRNGASLGTGLGYAAKKALGGTSKFCSRYSGGNESDILFYYAFLFKNVVTAETAALEAVIAANPPY